VAEAREAFHKLSRSDSGAVWRSAIAREIDLMAADEDETVPVAEAQVADEPAAILPLTVADEPAGDRDLAA
jgi:hypothetical protein